MLSLLTQPDLRDLLLMKSKLHKDICGMIPSFFVEKYTHMCKQHSMLSTVTCTVYKCIENSGRVHTGMRREAVGGDAGRCVREELGGRVVHGDISLSRNILIFHR